MATLELEERVAILEAEVARLKRAQVHNGSATQSWWEQVAGSFADDDDFALAMQLGRKYRASLHSPTEEHE